MADRIIELARHLAKTILVADALGASSEATELLDLVGEEGDPHPRNARHPSGETGKSQPRDKRTHAEIISEIPKGEEKLRHDTNYLPGVGFYFTDHQFSHWNWEHDQKHKGANLKYSRQAQFISEGDIMALANTIRAHRGMDETTRQYLAEQAREREHNHPGTDAVDSAKDSLHSGSDSSEVDHSRSTLYIGASSSTGTFLNASAVKHSRFIHIEIHGPDGREICDVAMTFEQFAAALTTHSHVPCTLHSYWSHGPDSVRLIERVREPPSMMDRMRNRIKDRMEEVNERIDDVRRRLAEAAEAGKPLGKKALAELARELEIGQHHAVENSAFAAEQAVEEVSAVVESAVIHLGQKHGVGLPAIAATPEIAHTLKDAVKLPAPKEE